MEHILLFIGAASFLGAYIEYFKFKRSETWPAVNIEIMDLMVKHHRKVSGNYVWDIYSPVITYRYIVNGKEYKSKKVSLDKYSYEFYSEKKANDLMCVIKNLSEARYNPENHGEAVLISEISQKRKSEVAALFAGGAILIVVWVGAVIL